MGGESPEEAGRKAVCSNVGQTDIIETPVKTGCSGWLINADLQSRKKRGKGGREEHNMKDMHNSWEETYTHRIAI